jgi:uncharacterized protein (TIGR02646 family)
MIYLVRPLLGTSVPNVELQKRYETWRTTKTLSLAPGSPKITSRWGQFLKGTGAAKDVGPNVLAAVREWQHHKCAWCESVEAHTFDHVEPKMNVPTRMFDWDNLLACCEHCNNARSHHDLALNHLILPTRDEPLRYFRWDPKTGACVFDPDDTRASDTAHALAMSRYQAERLHKLSHFRFYLACLLDPAPSHAEALERLRAELGPERPYLCVLRSWLLHPRTEDDRALRDRAFAKEPILLDWVRPWLHPWEGAEWPPSPV